MLSQRRFRGTNFPGVVFSNSAVCLESMGITLTKKEVLKEEDIDFEGIIEGTQISPAGEVIIRLKIYGWRDMDHHMGFWPTTITTDLMIETFELSKNEKELPDTLNAKVLHDEFNNRINLYVWHTAG
ncbi:MAG: hypothetical protein ACFFA5_00125 [Promethearchaeota archaeon]